MNTLKNWYWPEWDEEFCWTNAFPAAFDVFMTIDSNIESQQNLSGVRISIMLLEARSNKLEDLAPLVPEVLSALNQIIPGKILRIGTRATNDV